MNKKIKAIVVLMATLVMTMMMGVMVSAAVVAPTAVTNVRQTDASETSIKIQWDAILDANKYHIERSTDGVNFVEIDYTYSASESDFNLVAGSSFYYRVRASVRDSDTYEDVYGPYSPVIEAVTAPVKVASVSQTGATTNSFDIAWTPSAGATYYNIYKYADTSETLAGTSVATSGSFTNVTNPDFAVRVSAVRKSSSGFVAESYTSSLLFDLKTVPQAVSGLGITYAYPSIRELSFGWDAPAIKDGYEIVLYKGVSDKPWKVIEASYNNYSTGKINGKFAYRIKVRAYVEVNNQRLYGEYSPEFRYIMPQYKLKSYSSKHLTVSWKKMKGAKSYTVYMSDKSTGKYKKVKTIKGTSLKVTKFKKKAIKSNKTYYFKVVANYKKGKKTVKFNHNYMTYQVKRYFY